MGGGGSDNSYAQAQQKTENSKAVARNALNALFGYAPTAVSEANYQVPNSKSKWSFNSILGGFVPTSLQEKYDPLGNKLYGEDPSTYTDGSYEQAVANYNKATTDAAANKTARDALYQTIRDNAFTAGKRGFDERKTSAQRNNKFALFAQGLNGGSEDIDQNALLQRTYDQGLLDLGAKADTTKADIQASDEASRLQLLQSIDNGMDQSSAVSSAIGQLKSNADRATAAAQSQSIGDLFADAGLLYTNSTAAKGKAAARAAYPYLYSTSARPASSSGSSGIITPTG